MSKKTAFQQYEDISFYGDNTKSLVLITYAEIGRPLNELYVAQYFYKLADGSLKTISEPTYGDSEVHAVLKQTSIPVWLQRELDEIEYGIFKSKEVIDVQAHSEETR